MNTDRRSFLRKNLFIGSSLLLANSLDALAGVAKSINTRGVNQSQLNIMYTNDLRGKLNAAHQDFGGLRQLHNTIHNEEVSALLFDAGGFLNSSNSKDQQLRGIDIMNKINYHGVNLSAADLVQGIEAFKSLIPYINFQLLSCNYHFEDPMLRKAVKPYQILKYGKFKVGVTAVGEKANINGLMVSNPQPALNRISRLLKDKYRCDMVICLAHLGFDEKAKINNKILAESSIGVDCVIGGNATVSKSQLWIVKNPLKKEVLLSSNHHKGLSTATLTIAFNEQKERAGLAFKKHVPGADKNHIKQEILSLLAVRKNNINNYNFNI